MKTKSAPKPVSSRPPLGSYVAEFEQWMRNSVRCEKSEDVCQEIRFALWEIRDTPATHEEARRVFLRQVSIFEHRARRQVCRQGTLVESPRLEELAGSIERDTDRLLALFDALEQLDDHERWLVKECKIDGRTHKDVAEQLGLSEDAIRNRIWRAMAQLLAMLEAENSNEKTRKRSAGAIIAPLEFEFSDIEGAAFKAIWKAEGRMPEFGGGPPNSPPPPPPPVVPPVAPVAPMVSAAVGSAVSAATIAIVLVLLIFFSAGTVAIYYFWDPPHTQTAKTGLRVPSVNVVNDVVPLYPLPFPVEQTPKTPISGRAKTPAAPSITPSSSPPIDPEELEQARRRAPRSLPSRKK